MGFGGELLTRLMHETHGGWVIAARDAGECALRPLELSCGAGLGLGGPGAEHPL